MDKVKIIALKESVLEDNDQDARALREELRGRGTCLLNLMSSPGSGKTTTLLALNRAFGGRLRWAVMEADIESEVDAQRIESLGAKAVQVHTSGMCHMDAGMTAAAVEAIGQEDVDLLFLENVGNLICPAEYDTGAGKKLMILSVPEGDDKPLKYPLMFSVSDVLVITKTDVMPYFDFDVDACVARAKKLNPDITVFTVSAKTGDGFEEWENWLMKAVADWKN
jgi:hydrogenase nickel incorporation protein HypB